MTPLERQYHEAVEGGDFRGVRRELRDYEATAARCTTQIDRIEAELMRLAEPASRSRIRSLIRAVSSRYTLTELVNFGRRAADTDVNKWIRLWSDLRECAIERELCTAHIDAISAALAWPPEDDKHESYFPSLYDIVDRRAYWTGTAKALASLCYHRVDGDKVDRGDGQKCMRFYRRRIQFHNWEGVGSAFYKIRSSGAPAMSKEDADRMANQIELLDLI